MCSEIDHEEFADKLIRALIRRDYGELAFANNTVYEDHLGMFTRIICRQSHWKGEGTKNLLHELVQMNEKYKSLSDEDKEHVQYWMLCITVGGGFEVEYTDEDDTVFNCRE
jgi:hypothetical protein